MSKKTTIILIVAVALVLVLALCLHASFHLTKEESSCSFSTTSSNSPPTGDKLRLFHRIAIIAPEAQSADARLGNLIAEKLRKRLNGKMIALECRRGGQTVSEFCAKATIYRSAKEAQRSGADFYYTILPEQYSYSLWPFAKDWEAKVHVHASSRSTYRMSKPEHVLTPHADEPKTWAIVTGGENRYGFIEIGVDFDYSGRMVGIFTPSYLTSSIAEKIAKDAADDVHVQASEMEYEFRTGKEMTD